MEKSEQNIDDTTATLTQGQPISHNTEGNTQLMCGYMCIQMHIKEGLEVVDIVTPVTQSQQFKCKIKLRSKKKFNSSEDHIRQALSAFHTERIIMFRIQDQNDPFCWGKVLFRDQAVAMDTVEKINADHDLKFTLDPSEDDDKKEFTFKLCWWRREGKGHCFVELQHHEDLAKLVGYKIRLGNANPMKVTRSQRGDSLSIKNLTTYVTEEQIRDALAKRLGVESSEERFTVIIPRNNIAKYHKNEMEMAQNMIDAQLSEFVERDSFTANILPYREETTRCTAYVHFADEESCKRAADGVLKSGITVGNYITKTTVEFVGSTMIPKNAYYHVREDIDCYRDIVNETYSHNTLHVYEQESGNMSVNILAPSQHKLAKIKKDLDEIVEGYVVDLNTEQSSADKLFTNEAKTFLKAIEAATDTKIYINHRARKVTVCGLKKNINMALKQIHKFLKDIEKSSETVVDLKAASSCHALLRSLMIKYGPDLAGMVSATGLKQVELNLKEHQVHMVGDSDALLKTEETIKIVEEEMGPEDIAEKISQDIGDSVLSNMDKISVMEKDGPTVLENYKTSASSAGKTQISESTINQESDDSDCPVCLGALQKSDNICLQNCYHAYCKVCFISWIKFCKKNLAFPLTCMVPGCGEKLAICDIDKLSQADRADVMEAAVRSFVRENSDKYRFCLSPMCSTVYKVGASFRCPGCRHRFCTTCHAPLHQGISCKKYTKAKAK